MTGDLVLYGNDPWTSPYAFSVFVTLEEKGIEYSMELISLQRKDHQRAEYSEPSVTGRVPAIRHGDFWLAESSAIDEYLDEAFPPPRWPRIYPEDMRERARARMVQAFVRSDVLPLRLERPTVTLFVGEQPKPLTAEGKASAERLIRIASRLVTNPEGFICSKFSPADADLALMLQRLCANGDDCPPLLCGYANAIFARPSVRKWLSRTNWHDR
jgi:glutathione S-transferase